MCGMVVMMTVIFMANVPACEMLDARRLGGL